MAFWRSSESTFERLQQAEARLQVPSKDRKFPDAQAFLEAIRKRAALQQEIERALEAGKITKEQHDELIRVNKLHSAGLSKDDKLPDFGQGR